MSRGGKKKKKKAQSGNKETENSEIKHNPVKTSEVHSQKLISSQFSGLILRENSGQKLDRLRDLPHDILNLILRKLPLEEAIKTNLLSKQWKYKWTCISEFILEHNSSFARALIYQYLYNHNDAISKFKLPYKVYANDLCVWIRMLSEKGVNELILGDGGSVIMPTWLFRIKQLQFLDLGDFKIVVPSGFEGFVHLTSLVLKGISITDEGLGELLRKCRALESLKLSRISSKNLRIRGANLKHVEIDSSFGNIWFDKTTSLTSFDFVEGRYHIISPKTSNLFVVDGGLSNLEKFSLGARSSLVFKNIDRNELSHLTTIDIRDPVNLDYQEQLIYILSVLRMVPTLKNLKFSVCFLSSEGRLYFMKDIEPLSLTQLQSVSMEYDCSLGVLEQILQMVIGNSLFLETLKITKLVESRREVIEYGSLLLENLKRNSHWLKEVSSRVNIIYKRKIKTNYF